MHEQRYYEPKKKRRCPKCRSLSIVWHERWVMSTSYEQNENGVIDREGQDNIGGGTPDGVFGECDQCAHAWTPRGVHQITDLTEENKAPRLPGAIKSEGEHIMKLSLYSPMAAHFDNPTLKQIRFLEEVGRQSWSGIDLEPFQIGEVAKVVEKRSWNYWLVKTESGKFDWILVTSSNVEDAMNSVHASGFQFSLF